MKKASKRVVHAVLAVLAGSLLVGGGSCSAYKQQPDQNPHTTQRADYL